MWLLTVLEYLYCVVVNYVGNELGDQCVSTPEAHTLCHTQNSGVSPSSDTETFSHQQQGKRREEREGRNLGGGAVRGGALPIVPFACRPFCRRLLANFNFGAQPQKHG